MPQGHTLATLFEDALEEDPTKRKFDLDSTLIKSASGVVDDYGAPPRARRPPAVEPRPDRRAGPPRRNDERAGSTPTSRPTSSAGLSARVIDEYDWVLIDCPPNLGIITLNGLRISDGFVIPTIPDHLSTYGIPQILTRAAAFAENIGEPIEPLGVIISKFRDQSPSTTRQ